MNKVIGFWIGFWEDRARKWVLILMASLLAVACASNAYQQYKEKAETHARYVKYDAEHVQERAMQREYDTQVEVESSFSKDKKPQVPWSDVSLKWTEFWRGSAGVEDELSRRELESAEKDSYYRALAAIRVFQENMFSHMRINPATGNQEIDPGFLEELNENEMRMRHLRRYPLPRSDSEWGKKNSQLSEAHQAVIDKMISSGPEGALRVFKEWVDSDK